MIDYLNQNPALTDIITIIVTIAGFFFTNKNITKVVQNQNVTGNSKGIQGGRDIVDRSINFNK